MPFRRLALFAGVLVLSMTSAFGQSTYQRWKFNAEPADKTHIPPDEVENDYGAPNGSSPDGSHQATDGTHVGVLILDPTDVFATFTEPNVKVPGFKDVFLNIVYKQTGTEPLFPSVDSTDGQPFSASGNLLVTDPDADGYRIYARTFSGSGCPDVRVRLAPVAGETLALDDLQIRTTCHPTGAPTLSEWGTIVMTLLMATALTVLLVRRRSVVAGVAGGEAGLLVGSAVPLLAPRLFVCVLAATFLLAGMGLLVARWLTGPIPPTDVVGTILSAVILAYQAHLLAGHVSRGRRS